MGTGIGFFVNARNFVRHAFAKSAEQGISLIVFLEKSVTERVDTIAEGSVVTKAVANGTELQRGTNTEKGIQHSDLSKISDVLLTFAENAPAEVDSDDKLKVYLLRKLMEAEREWRSAKFFDFNQFFYRLKVR